MPSCSRPRRLLAGLLAITLSLSWTLALGDAVRLPDMGDASAAVVSPEQERRIGEGVVRNLRAAGHLIDDPLLEDYLESLGYQLAAGEAAATYDFDFFLVRDSSLNAFALPGGFIGVHYGLVLAAQQESELAAVLAHEIAHITQRHHLRRYTQAQGSSLTMTAALIAAVLLGSQGQEVGEAAMASIAASAAQAQIDFSRANEQEADRLGIALLADAGFDPQSMPAFFERMQQNSRLYGPGVPEFLRTHPVTASRIADSRSRAARYPQPPARDEMQYELVRARLQVLTAATPAAARHTFETRLAKGDYRYEKAARYGLALARIANDDFAGARSILTALLEQDPHRIAYVVALAQAEMNDGRTTEALDVYTRHLAFMPGNPALTYYYAEALLHSAQPERARSLLREFVRKRPASPEYYRLLAQAEAATGRHAQSHSALAEYHYMNGELRPAINQLELALRQKDLDFYTSSSLQARLASIKAEAEEQAAASQP